jgi:very-short-patch-repair endonuclease
MRMQIPAECRQLIARQDGVVARRQLLNLGMADDRIESLVRSGRLTPLQRGVYTTFSREPTRNALLWAAVLRAWPGALSHQSAAELFGFTETQSQLIHVTVPAARHPARDSQIPGVIVHRSNRVILACHPALRPPRTRIDETVIDLVNGSTSFDEAFGWLCRCVGQQLTTADRLRGTVQARSKMRWRTETIGAIAELADGVRSALELRYVRHVERAHALPAARRQAKIVCGTRTMYLDNLYDAARVAVELDGRAAHPVARRFEDMRRDSANAATGLTTLRYSWADVAGRACQTAAEVATVLQLHGWTGSPRRCGPGCQAVIP